MTALPAHVRELPRVFVGQGEVAHTREAVLLQTTLGSCVAVVIHDPLTGLGAICHALMPEAEQGDRSLRFTDVAVDHLLGIYRTEGIPLSRLTVRVFGGAAPVRTRGSRAGIGKAGERNVEVALQRLARAGVVVSSQDTGGNCGRRVLFAPSTGEVFVHVLRKSSGGA